MPRIDSAPDINSLLPQPASPRFKPSRFAAMLSSMGLALSPSKPIALEQETQSHRPEDHTPGTKPQQPDAPQGAELSAPSEKPTASDSQPSANTGQAEPSGEADKTAEAHIPGDQPAEVAHESAEPAPAPSEPRATRGPAVTATETRPGPTPTPTPSFVDSTPALIDAAPKPTTPDQASAVPSTAPAPARPDSTPQTTAAPTAAQPVPAQPASPIASEAPVPPNEAREAPPVAPPPLRTTPALRTGDPAAPQTTSQLTAPAPEASEHQSGEQPTAQDRSATPSPRPTATNTHQPAPFAPAVHAQQAQAGAPAAPTTPTTTTAIQGATGKPATPGLAIGLAHAPGAAKQAALARLTAQAPALKQGIAQASFIPQASKALTMALRQGEGTVTLRLTPESLGTLKVEITLQNAEVTAKLHASSESARQLLLDAQSSLRAALEARGLSVERIEVTAPNSADAQDARHNPDHRGTELAGDGRSRQRDSGPQHDSHGSAQDEPAAASPAPWQPPALTLALDDGGVYRLHLDAVA